MNLQEFVRDVLIEVNGAVDEARVNTSRDITFTENTNNRTIEFDIAITAETKDTANGKAGIRVLKFVEAGADMALETKNSTVSRVQFGLRIGTWTKEEEAREAAERRAHNSSLRQGNNFPRY